MRKEEIETSTIMRWEKELLCFLKVEEFELMAKPNALYSTLNKYKYDLGQPEDRLYCLAAISKLNTEVLEDCLKKLISMDHRDEPHKLLEILSTGKYLAERNCNFNAVEVIQSYICLSSASEGIVDVTHRVVLVRLEGDPFIIVDFRSTAVPLSREEAHEESMGVQVTQLAERMQALNSVIQKGKF
jgi:hypothetical protein